MVNPYLLKLTFMFVLIKAQFIIIKYLIKSMAYTVLQSHAYDIVLINVFVWTPIFDEPHARAYSDMSNPAICPEYVTFSSNVGKSIRKNSWLD